MRAAPIPENEAARLETLRQYQVLDTESEETFDDLARLAAYVCQTPTALISLVDANRQWFKARVGVQARETPRNVSFCGHAIGSTVSHLNRSKRLSARAPSRRLSAFPEPFGVLNRINTGGF